MSVHAGVARTHAQSNHHVAATLPRALSWLHDVPIIMLTLLVFVLTPLAHVIHVYCQIPNQSPLFDPECLTNGLMEKAAK
jgi:uncharacterized membrane protein